MDRKRHPYFAETDVGLRVDLWYPRTEGNPKAVFVGLVDVRAVDDLRITFDFDRNGWRIEQAHRFTGPIEDEVQASLWTEVAFIEAWGSKDEAWDAYVKGETP